MGVSVGVAVGASVDVPVGNRGFAVGAAVEFAMEIAVDLAVEIAVEVVMASARASTVHRYLPRHSVEARGMSVEARGRSAVARAVSAVFSGTPWAWTWNVVEVRGHYLGAPIKRQITYMHPSFIVPIPAAPPTASAKTSC